MLILRNAFIFALIIVTQSNAQSINPNCSCGVTNPPPIQSLSRPVLIQNPTSDGSSPCVANCTYVITLSPALAIEPTLGGLKPYIYSFSKGTDAKLFFYDGEDPDATPVKNITDDTTAYDQIPVTVNPSARMVLVEQEGSVPAQFFVSFTAAMKGAGPPTTTPPTLPFLPKIWNKNSRSKK